MYMRYVGRLTHTRVCLCARMHVFVCVRSLITVPVDPLQMLPPSKVLATLPIPPTPSASVCVYLCICVM